MITGWLETQRLSVSATQARRWHPASRHPTRVDLPEHDQSPLARALQLLRRKLAPRLLLPLQTKIRGAPCRYPPRLSGSLPTLPLAATCAA
ncbi:hypothetical protein METHP14_140043 [Pseudomonas sp. P14-2025]